jgi:hypothetical protein
MSDDPADLDLGRAAHDVPFAYPPAAPSGAFLSVVALVVIALVAGVFYWRRSLSEADAPAAAVPTAQLHTPAARPATISLPPLDETDPLVRRLVGALSSHPVVAAWLTTDGLLVNFVLVTTRIADGKPPARELKAIGPIEPFRPHLYRGVPFLDNASYRRYDRYAAAVEGLDAAGVGRLYATLKPRIDDAFARTGWGGDFDAVLERAITELLNVPIPDGPIALKPRGIGYAFVDSRLESLSASQKQLLRMGPANGRTIQRKLRDIASQVVRTSRQVEPTPRDETRVGQRSR